MHILQCLNTMAACCHCVPLACLLQPALGLQHFPQLTSLHSTKSGKVCSQPITDYHNPLEMSWAPALKWLQSCSNGL